jgi:hypothetical protein
MTTYVQYTANGSTAAFTVPFPYLQEGHIKVRVNTVLQIMGSQYDVTGPSTITFRPDFLPETGAVLDVYRETPTDALVAYQNGAVLTASDLNTATLQALYGLQETRDKYERLLSGGITRITNGTVVTPSEAIDALTQDVLNSALLAELQSRITDIDLNGEAILEQTLRVDALIDNIAALESGATGYATLITNEQTQRADADSALAATIGFIGAKSPDGLSFIFDADTAKIDSTTSLADKLSAMQSTLDGNTASIATESTTRATADAAFASKFTLLGTVIDSGSSWLLDTTKVKVDSGTSLAAKLTALEASSGTVITRNMTAPSSPTAGDVWVELDSGGDVVGNWRWSGTAWETIDPADIAGTKAALAAELTTRADADSALSSSITTLTSTVGANTSAISVNAAAIDGVNAKYTVKVDVNGYVSGYGLISTANNGTPTSEFIVLANKFSVVLPGKTPIVPFIVGSVAGASVVAINGALIVDGTITANAIGANSITAAKIAAGVISTDKLAANAVTADKIAAGAITAAKIGAEAITADKIAAGTITADRIVAKAITTEKLNDFAVTQDQIAGGATTQTQFYAVSGSWNRSSFGSSNNVWYDMTATGVDARVTMTSIPASGARVVIAMGIAGTKSGSTPDQAEFRVKRVSDGAIMSPSNIHIKFDVPVAVTWNFIDNAPPSASETYVLQTRSTDGNPVYLDIQLLATLFKK